MNKEKQKKQKLIPELRFPEFAKDEYWSIKPLKKVFSIFQGYSFSSKDSVEEGTRWLKIADVSIQNMKHNNPSFLPYDYTNIYEKFLIKKGDYVLALTRPILNGKLKISAVDDLLHNSLLNQRVGKLVSNENLTLIYYLLQTNYLIEEIEKSIAGSEPPNLSMKQIENIPISLPSNPKEQQKIANCLSSLDNLITAETEKLDHLKHHKKGLLQQLFPAEGETKPQYRFPEFENDGEWLETTLDDVADYANGKAHEKEISETGKYKVVNSKFISTEGEVVKYTNSANLKANDGDILMVLSDIPNGKAIAKCFYVDKVDTYTVNQRICKITPTDINNKFLFYIQNRNKYFLAFDDGVKQTNLRKDTVLSFPFLKPKDQKEQEKIANCLSNADGLIEQQTSKIATLKDHKKGLMQQLFPNVNDII